MRPSVVWRRIYADFLMPSRLASYPRLLDAALEAGYRIISVEQFWSAVRTHAVEPARQYLILRHDVDTDVRTASLMLEIERAHGVGCSSYFFRLNALDVELMRSIAAGGGEAGYHFEELATVVKRRGVRSGEEALLRIPEAQEDFRQNLQCIRALTGLPIRIVASHGDFANRVVGVPNWRLLDDARFRAEMGIDLEVYDDALVRHVTSRHSDIAPPRCWLPTDPLTAIEERHHVVYVLVHPRHWHVNRPTNARDDVRRIWQGLCYRWGIGSLARDSPPCAPLASASDMRAGDPTEPEVPP